ncbi:hypothetical protein QBC45DRAFT_368690 [Copromyces sp. CBS 386.78]|nr:hypothetical protein QBC45DRAFT_368690 [Copromyces sp. CBS 386.78]
MSFTYRILEPFDLNINESMLFPALEKATSKAVVEFPSVFVMQSTPSETVDITIDGSNSDSDSSEDEFFDAMTDQDLEWPSAEHLEDVSPADEDWTQVDWPKDDWTQDIRAKRDWIQDFWEQEEDETAIETTTGIGSHTDEYNTSESNDHPLAGWHSHRLAQSNWTTHSFIDKTDRIDVWSRHTEYSLAQCTWCVFPEDSGWPKPEADSSWGAPELRLTTPEGEVCWLDDPTDYESLPWEKQVAEERGRILGAIW